MVASFLESINVALHERMIFLGPSKMNPAGVDLPKNEDSASPTLGAARKLLSEYLEISFSNFNTHPDVILNFPQLKGYNCPKYC
jgi:hypothetical protein